MKNRILHGWNYQRIIFLIMGAAMMLESLSSHHWLGAIIGFYFASMGLFAFGCASGNCYGSSCDIQQPLQSATAKTDSM